MLPVALAIGRSRRSLQTNVACVHRKVVSPCQFEFSVRRPRVIRSQAALPEHTEIRAYGRCLEKSSSWFGGSVEARSCDGGSSQNWRVTPNGQITMDGILCLKVGYRARTDFCDGSSEQTFRVSFGGEIISQRTRECLSLQYFGFTRFEACDGDGRQRWAMPDLPDITRFCNGGLHAFVRITTNDAASARRLRPATPILASSVGTTCGTAFRPTTEVKFGPGT